MYDGDEPGIKSANRAIEKLLEHGFKVNIIILPDNDDPDSFIKKNKNENIKNILNNFEIDFLTFKINSINKNDINKETEDVSNILNLISSVPDEVYKTVLLKKVRDFLGIKGNHLFLAQKKQKQIEKKDIKPIKNDAIENFEREIIKTLLMHGDKSENGIKISNYIIEETNDISLKNEVYRQILKLYKENTFHNFNDFFNTIQDESFKSMIIELVTIRHEISEKWYEKDLIETDDENIKILSSVRKMILLLKKKIIQDMIEQEQKVLKNTQDENEISNLLTKISTLKQYELMISKNLLLK